METEYTDATEAFLSNLSKVLTEGNVITVRDMKTKELESVKIVIGNPLNRCYLVRYRNDNIFAKVAETLWMLAGRNDIEWLSYYLPRAKDYSDDGRIWRGAYGPRLRNWVGIDRKVDQISNVVSKLNLDPQSRQAVISIFDPSEDYCITKDVPCNNWLHFFIRDGKLNLNVAQRSCDILWGYSGIDTFSWSALQQMMAYWTGTEIGKFTHFITSLHIYEQYWETAKKILISKAINSAYAKSMQIGDPIPTLKFSTKFKDFNNKLWFIFTLENSIRAEPGQISLGWCKSLKDDFLAACTQLLVLHNMMKLKDSSQFYSWEDIGNVVMQMKPSDLRLSAIEYLTRKTNDLFRYITMESFEEIVLTSIYHRI